MDRSYPYSRRLLSRARLRKRMAAVAAAGLVAAAAVFMLAWKPDPISAALPSPFMPSAGLNDPFASGDPLQRGVRRIYPYSVVPGGVSGQAELKRIIRTDSVVAAHYASFDTGQARSVVVDKPRAVHVSYRKGDKVYWTAHKVMLAPGETLLSDGRNEMRARCANRISELPQYPVEAHKPAMEELDQPIELAEGEQYALGPDGLPVMMDSEGGIGRHAGVRVPTRGGGGSGSTGSGGGTPADGALASRLSSSAGSMGPMSTVGLSGSSSSLGSSPRPTGRPVSAPAAETSTPAAPDPVSGSGGSSGSSASPAPSGGGTTPVSEPETGTGEQVASPVPGTTTPAPPGGTTTPPGGPATTPEPESPPPAPLPGPDPAPGPVTQPPPAPPAPAPVPPATPRPSEPGPATDPVVPEPVVTKPTPQPLPPQPVELPEPTEVPEPGTLWMFGLALAAMGLLRRRRAG